MSKTDEFAEIQACITNPLDADAIGKKRIVGIIGDAPSHYAKSPAIWNSVFRAFNFDAIYLPFDVNESRLPDLVDALKKSQRVMGANVTVPYKLKIMDYLDSLDEKATQIKAVNTVVRTEEGRLIGYNTDGKGFLDSILTPQPEKKDPFVTSLKGIDILMIGAGGSARAVAFYLAEVLGKGQLIISNRSPDSARSLAKDINKSLGNARAILEEEVDQQAPKAGLIINCSTKGQGGIRKTSTGKIMNLEPYSALAPANPATIAKSEYGKPKLYQDWIKASQTNIEENNQASLNLARSIPVDVGFCDLIYFPTETVFLRHGRLTGHRTLNGRGMNVAQAADALFNKVCKNFFQKLGIYNSETYSRVVEIMVRAW